jgi:aspartate dehydrogenase
MRAALVLVAAREARARDVDAPPLGWAIQGSMRPGISAGDHAACVRLLQAGAACREDVPPTGTRRSIACCARICYQLEERMGDEAMRLGLIGCGAIGGEVVRASQRGRLGPDVQLAAVLVRRPRSEPDPLISHDPKEFFERGPDAVVECAGHEAVREHAVRCLESGADLVLTSIGALVDDRLREHLGQAAAHGGRLIIASAGIGALDILGAAAIGGLERVQMTVRKGLSAWYGTEAEHLYDLAALRGPVVIYEGTVREGAARYPQNVNISAAVALAGLGLDRTQLTIIADPTSQSHIIEIEAEGAFGSFRFCEDVRPTEANPKTGKLVAMAVIKTIRQLAAPVVIGG